MFSLACGIADPDNQRVLITGGSYSPKNVSVYGKSGYIEDLASLKVGRARHACTSFILESRRV